jgi:hypothetical protein
LYGTVRISFWLNLVVICILHLMHCATQFVFL